MEMSRRGFLELTGAAAVSNSAFQLGETEFDPDDVEGYGLLLGPSHARPSPNGPYLDQWDTYRFVYFATDSGEKSYISHTDTDWTDLPTPMDLKQYSTPYDSLKTAQQYTQFALDPSKGLTRRRYSWFSNNTLFDSTLFTNNESRGAIEISTGNTAANEARIHSAIAGQYLSQSLAQPGVGLDVAEANVSYDANGYTSLSHGTIAVGAGWHDKSVGGWGVGGPVQTFLGLTLRPDGAYVNLISSGSHLDNSPVHQSEWNLDKMDGSGGSDNPSGQQFRPDNGYVYQFPYTWYSHGALYVGIADPVTEQVIRFHKFNVPRSSFDRPNLTPILIVDDDGTAADLTARLGGMQYALYGSQLGEEGTEERGVEIPRTNFDITTASVDANGSVDPIAEPGDPIMAFRRETGVRDLAIRLDSMFAELGNSIWVFMWDEYDPANALTGANFRNPNEAVHPDDETLLEVDTEATDYTPTKAVSRGIDYIYTGKNQESLESLSTNDRVPIDATRVITAAHDGTSATVDPAVIRAIEGY